MEQPRRAALDQQPRPHAARAAAGRSWARRTQRITVSYNVHRPTCPVRTTARTRGRSWADIERELQRREAERRPLNMLRTTIHAACRNATFSALRAACNFAGGARPGDRPHAMYSTTCIKRVKQLSALQTNAVAPTHSGSVAQCCAHNRIGNRLPFPCRVRQTFTPHSFAVYCR